MPNGCPVTQLIVSSLVVIDSNKELNLGNALVEAGRTRTVHCSIGGVRHMRLMIVVIAKGRIVPTGWHG